jgi:hypothetical protein
LFAVVQAGRNAIPSKSSSPWQLKFCFFEGFFHGSKAKAENAFLFGKTKFPRGNRNARLDVATERRFATGFARINSPSGWIDCSRFIQRKADYRSTLHSLRPRCGRTRKQTKWFLANRRSGQ